MLTDTRNYNIPVTLAIILVLGLGAFSIGITIYAVTQCGFTAWMLFGKALPYAWYFGYC